MYRNRFWAAALLFLCLLGSAQAAQRSLVLLLGDVESRPAVLAVRSLQAELHAAQASVHVIAANAMSPADREALVRADVAVLNVLSRQVTQSLTEELQALQDRGQAVFGLGSTVDARLQELGVREDPRMQAYYRAGGVENMVNLIRYLLHTEFSSDMAPEPVRPMPDVGLYDIHADRVVRSFDEYIQGYGKYRPQAPWIGIMFYRASLVSGQTLPLTAIAGELEDAGYNVLPAFGYPYDVPLRHFLDETDKPRVDMIVALGMKVGGTAATGAVLEKIGVPVINAITLSQQSFAQWQESTVGLDLLERTWQMAGAELAGLIQPTVVASRERIVDSYTGLLYIEEQPISERVKRLRARVDAWMDLRQKKNADKRLAVLYYNYPHGSETIGAAYLNVLPESMWQILRLLNREGYLTHSQAGPMPADKRALQDDIQRWGSYPAKEAKEYLVALAQLAESGQAVLVPLADYRRWYQDLPVTLRTEVEAAWGKAEQAPVLWRERKGEPHFVFPARRYGNILLAPQPGRAWEQNLEKLHNEVTLPPSHEYMAFYLWLQHGYQSNAVMHVGTHGTHEWLSGKEAGLSEADPAEALIGALPNIYPYVMDDVGEGLQAKRRGMATIIDHMTPPFDAAGLNPDLRELNALLNDYRVALQKSPLLARSHLTALNRLAKTSGVLKDMRLKRIETEADLEALEDYLDSTAAKLTPFGLHTFGVPPEPAMRSATARAVVSVDKALSPEKQKMRIAELEEELVQSAHLELERLAQALEGRYIPAGPSADLIRNPDALPTGRNFFGIDPSRIPSRTTYEQGALLAERLINDYRTRHGTYPDKLTVNLWGVETSRHEGIMEAQVLALLGVRPVWNQRGRVTEVEAIPRDELGRPRVDVTMISSGLFRDLFGNILSLLDQAARLAQAQDETDNALRLNSKKTEALLQERGTPPEEARQLAAVRIFGLPSGGYGTNIEKLIPLANAWQQEQEVAEVFINRMSHPFMWQADAEQGSAYAPMDSTLRKELFKTALSGSKIALHSRSSNLFATLDNDDFFQYLGGTALAIRSVDGKTPEIMVSDLSNPRHPRHSSLEQYMGQELQTRYLNPRWADGMLQEGYAGARFINRVVDYLWAWQVTVPEVVDASKWQRMYDTYIADRHGLKVRERFAESGNLKAFQAITDRMLTAIERGYWKPSDATVKALTQANDLAIRDAGVACSENSCSQATLARTGRSSKNAPDAIASPDRAPGGAEAGRTGEVQAAAPVSTVPPVAAQAPASVSNEVSGFEMQSVTSMTPIHKTIGVLVLLFLAISFIGLGYWWRRRAR
jgi:cobaltochelatase CobN